MRLFGVSVIGAIALLSLAAAPATALEQVRLAQNQSPISGVSIIARTHGSLKRQGGILGLLCPGGHVLDVFRALHLLDVIPSFKDEAQALASFQSQSSSQSTEAPEGTTLFG